MSAVFATEQATVFRTSRRRYFTKQGAYLGAARDKIQSRCDCEPPDYTDYETGYAPIPCRYHEDMNKCDRIMLRLARWYKHLDTPPPQ